MHTHIYTYTHRGGTGGVMVIVGYGHSEPSSNQTNTLGKGINPIILSPVMATSKADWASLILVWQRFRRRKSLNSNLLNFT